MNPLRTALVLPDLAGGGAQRVMLTVASGLSNAGYSPTIIVLGGADTLRSELPAGLDYRIGNADRVRSGLHWLVRTIRELRPHAVISVMGYLNVALLSLRSILPTSTAIIVREANTVASTLTALPRWLPGRSLYRRLYPQASAIVSPTNTIANEIGQIAIGAKARLRVIPNPVDVLAIRARAARNLSRRPGDGLRLVAAGRLTHQKGFDRLIELVTEFPASATLDIFGEGAEQAALESRISTLRLSPRIRINGFSRDLPSHVAGADAFLLPSRWEGLPNVVLESLALGTPAICSDEAEVAELAASSNPTAVTVAPVGEPFTSAISHLSANPARSTTILPSLLPASYEKAAVIEKWTALLDELTHK